MGDGCRIAAAFGYQSFSHITDCIEIEMGKRANQAVCPVVGRQGDLFARYKFQAAVRTEMNHGIRLEILLDPEVRSDIMVRRDLVRTMHGSKGVIACTLCRLG